MSSSKIFRERLTQLAVARDGENILAAMAYVANHQPLSAFGVTNAASATVFRTGTSASLAVAAGMPVKVAASTNFPALTGLSVANNSKVIIAFMVDNAGNLTQAWGDQSTAVAGVKWPDIPKGVAVVGYCLLENASGSAFTGGTTALDAAGITLTYANGSGPLAPISLI